MKHIKSNTLRNIALSAIISVSSMTSSLSHANDNQGPFFGKKASGKWIIGGKISKVDLNQADSIDVDAAGIVLGYEFARSVGNSGGTSTVELEYISGDDDISSLGGANIDVEVANLFFTYRSSGTLYYKVKGGISAADIEVNSALGGTSSASETGLAGGIGLGYRVGDLGVIELEYQVDASDADLGIISLNGLLEF